MNEKQEWILFTLVCKIVTNSIRRISITSIYNYDINATVYSCFEILNYYFIFEYWKRATSQLHIVFCVQQTVSSTIGGKISLQESDRVQRSRKRFRCLRTLYIPMDISNSYVILTDFEGCYCASTSDMVRSLFSRPNIICTKYSTFYVYVYGT